MTFNRIAHATSAEFSELAPPPHQLTSIKAAFAANFSFAQLAKRKSLGRSKPATNSQAQALATHCVEYSTISKSYRTPFYRNKLSTTRCE